MPECTFCLCSLAETEGFVIPDQAFRTAIQKGFQPEHSPAWEKMKDTAVKAINNYDATITEESLSQRWKQRLSQPGRFWRLCERCYPCVAPFLPPNPQDFAPMYSSGNDRAASSAMNWVVPLNTSPWAILASYAGLISVLLVPAPIAFILGVVALNHIHRNPKYSGKGRAWFAIIMGTIFTLALYAMFIAG